MTEASLVPFFLGLIALCALPITLALFMTASALWRTSRRLDAFLSNSDKTLHEAHRTLGTARQLLARTDKAAARVESLIDKSCGVAEEVLEQIHFVKEKAHAFWSRQFGNGARLVNKRRGGL